MPVPEKALLNDLKTFMVYKCLIDIKKGELRDMFERITVFDVETPNRQNNRICSIGITRIENNNIVFTESFLVNPECCFDDFNIRIHGIRPENVKSAPAFSKLWEKIKGFFFDGVVVAHNASFDLSVLRKTLSFYEIYEDKLQYIDTYALTKCTYKNLANYKLDTICDYLNIDLNHHDSGSDSFACAKIILNLIQLGQVSERDICEYSFKDDSSKCNCEKKLSETSQALEELIEILKMLVSDGIVAEQEIYCLNEWVKNHSYLRGNYPFDDVFLSLERVLEDNFITEDELQQMYALFNEVIDPVGSKKSECSCSVSLAGKNVCLSGEFNYGSKSAVSQRLIQKGAIIQKSVTRTTDIVLVGSLGSDAWVTGNYGTKIKKALEMQENGLPIVIVKEADFIALED